MKKRTDKGTLPLPHMEGTVNPRKKKPFVPKSRYAVRYLNGRQQKLKLNWQEKPSGESAIRWGKARHHPVRWNENT